jgi:3-isopropylmalate/(R)-2-methylmalate dehydratase small subunit
LENVDTDQLIPARFMSRPRSAGYGDFLLHDLRFNLDGVSRPDFPLNDGRYAGAKVLVARRNFGTGSSREAAVYALWDYGIRCVIAPSFGAIFEGNAIKNGLLPAVVNEHELLLIDDWLSTAERPVVVVDLEQAVITAGSHRMGFVIEAVRRLRLLNGWDDLDLTDRHQAEIAAFRAQRFRSAPWVVPPRDEGR